MPPRKAVRRCGSRARSGWRERSAGGRHDLSWASAQVSRLPNPSLPLHVVASPWRPWRLRRSDTQIREGGWKDAGRRAARCSLCIWRGPSAPRLQWVAGRRGATGRGVTTEGTDAAVSALGTFEGGSSGAGRAGRREQTRKQVTSRWLCVKYVQAVYEAPPSVARQKRKKNK